MGLMRRNHAVVDHMMDKMLTADRTMKPKDALAWSVTAANSLDNIHGFSPAQLVFGRNPSYPSLHSAGVAGMEEVELSTVIAEHIHAMHLAREMFVQCESDRVLAEALKRRVYVGAGEIYPGMWIFFKQRRRWMGPVKVHSIDGKKLYAVRAGKLLTINRDDVMLAKSDEVSPSQDPLLSMPPQEQVDIAALRAPEAKEKELESTTADDVTNKEQDNDLRGAVTDGIDQADRQTQAGGGGAQEQGTGGAGGSNTGSMHLPCTPGSLHQQEGGPQVEGSEEPAVTPAPVNSSSKHSL